MSRLAQLRTLIHLTRRRARDYGEPTLPALWRMLRMLGLEQYSPGEIRKFAPHLQRHAACLPILISKEASLARQRRYNPPGAAGLTEDKHRFARYCAEQGLPTPRHILTLSPDDERYPRLLASPDGLAALLPEHFIVKDRHGAYGRGFAAFHRLSGARWESSTGEQHDARTLLARLAPTNGGELLIQERVFDHPDLAALSASHSLQTVRITTYRDSRGDIRPAYFFGKLLGPGNLVDNFAGGATGNLSTFGDLETGVLQGGVAAHPSGMGLCQVLAHAGSGRDLKGFQMPFWTETLALARRAHRAFPALRAVGWDLAITAGGPLLIEGNAWFDPPLFAPHIMADEDWSLLFGPGYRVSGRAPRPGWPAAPAVPSSRDPAP